MDNFDDEDNAYAVFSMPVDSFMLPTEAYVPPISVEVAENQLVVLKNLLAPKEIYSYEELYSSAY